MLNFHISLFSIRGYIVSKTPFHRMRNQPIMSLNVRFDWWWLTDESPRAPTINRVCAGANASRLLNKSRIDPIPEYPVPRFRARSDQTQCLAAWFNRHINLNRFRFSGHSGGLIHNFIIDLDLENTPTSSIRNIVHGDQSNKPFVFGLEGASAD